MESNGTIFSLADGAWSYLTELKYSRNFEKRVAKTLQRSQATSYLEIDEACEVFVLAELMATLRGAPHESTAKNVLRGAPGRNVDFLRSVFEATLKELDAVARSTNELRELAGEDEFQGMVADLRMRLNSEPNKKVADSYINYRPPRVREGDVFRIGLTESRVAYARLLQQNFFYVYDGIYNLGDPPPIGRREFLFYALGLYDEIGNEQFPVVGKDRLTDGECRSPAVRNGARTDQGPWRNLTTIFDLPPPFPSSLPAFAYQAIGIEPMDKYTSRMLVERILRNESSVEISLRAFSRVLEPEDIEKAREALNGRKTRLFDAEENLRFELGSVDVNKVKAQLRQELHRRLKALEG